MNRRTFIFGVASSAAAFFLPAEKWVHNNYSACYKSTYGRRVTEEQLVNTAHTWWSKRHQPDVFVVTDEQLYKMLREAWGDCE